MGGGSSESDEEVILTPPPYGLYVRAGLLKECGRAAADTSPLGDDGVALSGDARGRSDVSPRSTSDRVARARPRRGSRGAVTSTASTTSLNATSTWRRRSCGRT